MQWRQVLVAGVLAVGLAGCITYPPEHYGFGGEPPYTLDSGDEVRIIVFEAESLPRTFIVSASGHISVPVAGIISVRGRTSQEVERAIAGRLRGHYITTPMVSVQVVAYRPFFIQGEVNRGGRYPFTPGLTVESAVAIAGGYTERSYVAQARIVRPGPGGSTTVTYVPAGHPIRPGDTVFIPERWF